MAIAVAGLGCALREVKLSAKPQAMLAASPKGTVPVLVLADGAVIDESLDIMRWALSARDPEGWLAGDDAALIAWCDGPFKYDLDRYKYPERHGCDPDGHRASGLAFLQELDRRLAPAGQLCGPRRTMTDEAIMPFVRQFAGVDPAWFAQQSLPALQRWLAGHVSSTLFGTIMVRLAPWTPGDPPVLLVPDTSRAE